jgi:hypothetical protein
MEMPTDYRLPALAAVVAASRAGEEEHGGHQWMTDMSQVENTLNLGRGPIEGPVRSRRLILQAWLDGNERMTRSRWP